MIHYHVWFDLKSSVPEAAGLATVTQFLEGLCAMNEATTFQLLRNKGTAPRSKLSRYHALVQFADDDQLGRAMKNQASRGIHSGLHGAVMDVVSTFHVEIFSLIEGRLPATTAALPACEI